MLYEAATLLQGNVSSCVLAASLAPEQREFTHLLVSPWSFHSQTRCEPVVYWTGWRRLTSQKCGVSLRTSSKEYIGGWWRSNEKPQHNLNCGDSWRSVMQNESWGQCLQFRMSVLLYHGRVVQMEQMDSNVDVQCLKKDPIFAAYAPSWIIKKIRCYAC